MKHRPDFRARRSERGVALAFVMIVLFGLVLPMVGLAVDVGVLYAIKAKMQASADGAAMAAARGLARGLSLGEQKGSAIETAERYFNANMGTAWERLQNQRVSVSFPEESFGSMTVAIDASIDAPTYFMRLIGFERVPMNVHAEATRRNINVMLVLDRSRSLANSGSCDDLQLATRQFVGAFQEERDRVGLVTFGSTYRVDYRPDYTFQTSLNDMATRIRCIGGTSAAAPLWQSWVELKNLGDRGALNAIVFFTDGQPNSLYLRGMQMNCGDTGKTNWEGALITSGTDEGDPAYGLEQWLEPSFPAPTSGSGDLRRIADTKGSTGAKNCEWTGNQLKILGELNGLLPGKSDRSETDAVGNRLDTGFMTVPRLTSGTPRRIKPTADAIYRAAMNATDNAALRARADADANNFNLIIHTIGLGDVNHTLLRRIANTRDSGIHNDRYAEGMYLYAENGGELDAAFATIASDMLRISK